MKKYLLLPAFLCAAMTLSAQTIRTNYRSEGMTHISTEFEKVTEASVPFSTRVELVGFPDGSTLYLLYIDFEQKTSVNAPKGTKMAATLQGGKIVRAEQIGTESATKRRLDNGLFLNRLKYAVETPDMEKMVRGVKSLDIVTGWDPDDYIQCSFPSDAVASRLTRHCDAITAAAENTLDLKAELGGYSDQLNSTMSTSLPVVATGSRFLYNVILSHLYYKNTATEDIDLAFQLGTEDSYPIPVDSPIIFETEDGKRIELKQTRDENNFIYVYPSLDEVRALCSGVKTLRITTDKGVLEDTFPSRENGFSAAVNQQYQLLMSLSPR